MRIREVECRRRIEKADEARVCEIVGRGTLLDEVAGGQFGKCEKKARVPDIGDVAHMFCSEECMNRKEAIKRSRSWSVILGPDRVVVIETPALSAKPCASGSKSGYVMVVWAS